MGTPMMDGGVIGAHNAGAHGSCLGWIAGPLAILLDSDTVSRGKDGKALTWDTLSTFADAKDQHSSQRPPQDPHLPL